MGRMGKTLVQLLLLAGWDVDFWKVALQSFFAEKRIAEIDAKIDANISADGKVDIYSPYIRHMLG